MGNNLGYVFNELMLRSFFFAIYTYIIYLLMKNVFENTICKIIEILTYIIFFTIGVIVEILNGTPMVLGIYSFIGIFLISFNYRTVLKKRIFYVLFIVLIFIITEIFVALILEAHNPTILKRSNFLIRAEFLARMINFLTVLFTVRIKEIYDGKQIPYLIWGIIIYVPISSILIFIIIYETVNLSRILKGIVLSLVLGTNFMMLYLYNSLSSFFQKAYNEMEMKQHTLYYENELKVMQKNQEGVRRLKHDMENHINAIYGLLEQRKYKECMEYLKKINGALNESKAIANSGNTVIDSIINYKLSNIDNQNVKFNINLKIATHINIPNFDIAVLVGNLVDNALEAVTNLNEDCFIEIFMKQEKGMLIIVMNNSFDGMIEIEKNKFLSKKRSYKNYGNGSEQIHEIVKKYNGILEYKALDKIFSVNVLLYI